MTFLRRNAGADQGCLNPGSYSTRRRYRSALTAAGWKQLVKERTPPHERPSMRFDFACEVRDDVGMARRDVLALARIVGEIEKKRRGVFFPCLALAVRAARNEVRLVRALSNGPQLIVPVVEKNALWHRSSARERGAQIDAVNRSIARQRRSGESCRGGKQVHRRSHIRHDPWSDRPRPPENAWRPHAAFPRCSLAGAKRARRPAVRAEGQPWTVVAAEDDERPAIEPVRVQRVEDAAGARIELLDDVTVDPGGTVPFEIRRSRKRDMRKRVGEVEKERLRAMFVDETY